MDADEDIVLRSVWMRQVSVHWWKDKIRNSLVMVDSDDNSKIQGVESSVCGFSEM